MATLFIKEYATTLQIFGEHVPVPKEPAIATQTVTYTSSANSDPFNKDTRFIRVIADAKAHISFGKNPTATVADAYIVADDREYFGVEPGIRIAAYDGSS